jgi:hypothetical protein
MPQNVVLATLDLFVCFVTTTGNCRSLVHHAFYSPSFFCQGSRFPECLLFWAQQIQILAGGKIQIMLWKEA